MDIARCYKGSYNNFKTFREMEKILSTRVYVIYRAMSIEFYYAHTNTKLCAGCDHLSVQRTG